MHEDDMEDIKEVKRETAPMNGYRRINGILRRVSR
jgi:hypothetical protein